MGNDVFTQGAMQMVDAIDRARAHDEPRYVSPADGDFEERGTEAQIAALYMALAKAQGEFLPIEKSRTVKITGKANYAFEYAPMEELIAKTRPALTKHGLVVLMPFTMKASDAAQVVIVAHEGGGRLVYRFLFHPAQEEKVFGGQTTYLQRYCYRSVLSLAADGDLDDNPVQGGNAEAGTRNQAPQQQRQQPAQARQEPNRNPPPKEEKAPVSDPNADPAHEARRVELLAMARAGGYKTVSQMANYVFSVLTGGEAFVLNEQGRPFCEKLTIEQMETVMRKLAADRGAP